MHNYSEITETVKTYLSHRHIEIDEETLHTIVIATIIALGYEIQRKEDLN